jgi:hypothetical protein
MSSSSPVPYRWECVTPQAPFAPRDGAGALVWRDRMWLLGGWNPDDPVNFPRVCNSEVWVSADGRDWDLVTRAAPWEGRHTAGYAVHRGLLWVVGGDPIQGHYQDDVWCSADGRHWDCVSRGAPWGPRVLHHLVAWRDHLWLLGGQTLPQFAAAPECFYADCWVSADGRQWRRVADDLPWGPRGMIGGAAVCHDRLWLLGGGTYDTPARPTREFHHDVWNTADGQSWQRVNPACPWPARQYHEVAAHDGHLWVLEGYGHEGRNLNDVWYSPDGVAWTEVPDTPWAPRHAASVFVHRGALWMVAGNNMSSDVWRLDRR